MYNKKNDILNSFYENHKDEINSIILNYILIKSMIYASEVIEKVVSNIEQGKRSDKEVRKWNNEIILTVKY